ncbi:MAG TPA: septum site-determining protein MinC [Candidatus Binatus sp.]|nr:septum site-determining protein MinC [Candidatus Binatus sp.]
MQIKGTKSGLLLHLPDRPLSDAVAQLRERLSAQPGFYQGSRAVLLLGSEPAQSAELAAVIATLEQFGIIADGAVCDSDDVAQLAKSAGLRLVGASIAASPRARDDRIAPHDERSHARDRSGKKAQSNGQLVGAGETMYHKGTVRSGQSLSSRGNIVVIGDVNAGGELIAAGDILVWGALRGVAHAGAEGDAQAKVFALRLEPMQLRIATKVAVAPDERRKKPAAEVARLRDGGIVTEPAT